jgi:pSer/pThr/pTyr-binding forkhead associated (FHA) protein
MNPAVLLLILRLISATLLLLFLGVIAWLIYRDIKMETMAADGLFEPKGTLRVVSSPANNLLNQSFPIYSETPIGRSSENTIVVDDAYTSNQHAFLRKRGGQWWLEDLGSRNGTLLNDMLLTEPAVVVSGDTLTIGRTSLVIELSVSE